jgi:hypothetical protein
MLMQVEPTQTPLNPPTREHVMELFGYMVLKVSVLKKKIGGLKK